MSAAPHAAPADLADRVDDLAGAVVLCVGDIMLDRFVHGAVERISPEAPVPVLKTRDPKSMLGGVGNVARNIAALGAGCRLVAAIGDDDAGREVAAMCRDLPGAEAHLVPVPGRRTGIKTRFFAAGQQILRTDDETVGDLPPEQSRAVRDSADACMTGTGAVVLSDYGKGVLTDDIVGRIVALARKAGLPVVVDPKGVDFGRYAGADLVTPNRHELAAATGLSTASDAEMALAAQEVIDRHEIKAVLTTRGADGMTLLAEGRGIHLPTQAREVFDVSGAGDTVVALVAAGLAAGLPLADAARLANAGAGVVVGKTGTAVVLPEELKAALDGAGVRAAGGAPTAREAALEQIGRWRRRGLTIGFTNGCFDLLHPGHVALLRQARAACDRLVVGLNGDDSVRRLKGDGRPVQPLAARAAVLDALATVDLVVAFDEDTPLALIEALRPDVLVKGADYAADQVVGADLVEGYGGRVLLADVVEGHGTSEIIARSRL